MQEHALYFQFKARYYSLGEVTKNTKQIWFVLHGYGQLAGHFIRKFNILLQHDICIVAPEGLSRFYVDTLQSSGRNSDRVGATWMTKDNRLADIENYVLFLNTLYARYMESSPAIPVTVLGFSQGAATASRWVIDHKIKFERLVLWSGIFPPDMNFEAGREILAGKKTLIVYGKSDPYLNDNRFAEMEAIAAKLNITPQLISFDGAHEIIEETLVSMI